MNILATETSNTSSVGVVDQQTLENNVNTDVNMEYERSGTIEGDPIDDSCDADSTLLANEHDEALNEKKLIESLLQKIFLNSELRETEYENREQQLEEELMRLQDQLTVQDAVNAELTQMLAESENERKKMKNEAEDARNNLNTKLCQLREDAGEYYLVMKYALEQYWSRFNKNTQSVEQVATDEVENEDTEVAEENERVGAVDEQYVDDEQNNEQNGTENEGDTSFGTSADKENLEPAKNENELPNSPEEAVTHQEKPSVVESENATLANINKAKKRSTKMPIGVLNPEYVPRVEVVRMVDWKAKRVDGCRLCLKSQNKTELFAHLHNHHNFNPRTGSSKNLKTIITSTPLLKGWKRKFFNTKDGNILYAEAGSSPDKKKKLNGHQGKNTQRSVAKH